ncbi:MAG: BrnA antitoxin family protein [Burkholderiaceae bacterium]|nr:BrnA antitoxin family protein [Burkholderiaceae bacterium]
MKHENTSKTRNFSAAQIKSAIAAAPDRVDDADSPYDPSDAAAVEAFWAKGKLSLPGQHTHRSANLAVTIPCSPEVIAYFQSKGDDWRMRMYLALRDWVRSQPKD